MEEVFKYVFGNLDRNDRAIHEIKKKLHTQGRFNKNVIITYAILTAAIGFLKMESRQRDAEIERLNEEIEELKHKEGE